MSNMMEFLFELHVLYMNPAKLETALVQWYIMKVCLINC